MFYVVNGKFGKSPFSNKTVGLTCVFLLTLHFLQSIEIIYGSFYKLSHARKFLTQKIYHIVFALFLKILEFPSGPSINKVRTLKFGDFRHHLPSCTLLNN